MSLFTKRVDKIEYLGYNEYRIEMGFEVVNFAATMRRWYDKGNLRDAGGCCARQSPSYRGSKVDLLPFLMPKSG